jgi:predicted RNA methylase
LSNADWLQSLDEKNKYEILARLEDLTRKLPPQSWRGREQKELQQFSTPPALAYLLLQMLRPEAGKLALEPSAGTGSLAVWLRKSGCLTIVNEISARRITLLELQNFEPYSVNAEFLDDLLPARIKPDYVLMNPPFSAKRREREQTGFKLRLSPRRSCFAEASARRSSRRSARRRRLP